MTPGDPEKGHAGGTPWRCLVLILRWIGVAVLGAGEWGRAALASLCGVAPSFLCGTTYYDGLVEGDLYDGLPVDRLPIDVVDVPDQAHLRRSDRYRGAVDIELDPAIEAVFDPCRLVVRDPKSRLVRQSGWSATRRGWIEFWLWCSMAIRRADCGMSLRRGRRIAACVASTAGKRARMADKEILDRIEAAVEDAEEMPDEELDWTRHREPAKAPTAVYSVRIPVERIEELRQLAAERDVPPTALIRTWVLAQLDAARSPEDYAQRWERDVRATAEQLRKLLDERPGAPWAEVS